MIYDRLFFTIIDNWEDRLTLGALSTPVVLMVRQGRPWGGGEQDPGPEPHAFRLNFGGLAYEKSGKICFHPEPRKS